MGEIESLRNRGASEDAAKGAAHVLYPSQSKNDKSYRARFMRLFRAPDHLRQKGIEAWKERGAHVDKVLKLIPTTGTVGAPKKNLNALGKRLKSQLDTMNGTWRAASAEDQAEFLRMNRLRRLASPSRTVYST